MYSKFGQFIHGKWQPSEKNETYDVINPATEEVIGKASKATKADVTKALKWYARLRLGEQIKNCVEEKGYCYFRAEL